jgi:hypothetical protein
VQSAQFGGGFIVLHRVPSFAPVSQPQDIRSVGGAAQLTGLINRTGEVSRRQLDALLEIARNTAGGFSPEVVNI